jgi:hypothetical protein
MDAGFPLSFVVNAQPDIHVVENRKDHEAVAFAELKAVLAKHGLLRKYGIALLHKHFDLAEDEIMVEYTDLENRTQTLKPTKVGVVRPTDLVETVWALDLDTASLICQTWCYYYGGSNVHQVNHRQSG